MRLPYLMSLQACTLTTSPSLTRKLFLATLRQNGIGTTDCAIVETHLCSSESCLLRHRRTKERSRLQRDLGGRTWQASDGPLSFLFLPRMMIVSPRKRPRASIVAGLILLARKSAEYFRSPAGTHDATELSSAPLSSQINLLGDFLLRRIAVLRGSSERELRRS
jgi:hypothetical protein